MSFGDLYGCYRSVMSDQNTTPPSIQSVMQSQAGTQPAAGMFAPVTPPPSLATAMAQTQQAAQPQLGQQPQPQVAPATTTAAEDVVISEFRSLGYMIPDGMSRKEFLDTVASQIDDANRIREEFEPHQTQFAEWVAQQKKTADPQASQNALPAPPATVNPASSSVPAAGSPTISETTRQLQAQGLLSQGENGFWKTTDPGLQAYAEEANRVVAHHRAIVKQLADNPDQFITTRAQSAFEQFVDPIQKRIEQLESQLAAERQQASDSQVDSWIQQNKEQLFVGGDQSQPTSYAQSYNSFAAIAESNAQSMGQSLSRAQLHEQTLRMLNAAGVSSQVQPTAPQQPAPQPAPQPQMSFMQQAAVAPVNGTNRLSQYQAALPANQPNGRPQLGRVVNGVPNLRTVMALQASGQLPQQ